MDSWMYYNHAAVPTTDPHIEPNTAVLADGSLWQHMKQQGHSPLLARWTTDFDCGEQTNWWYVIKDTPLDLTSLKAKRRYEITRGTKFFDVRRIDPGQYKQELLQVQVAAFSAYPAKYRPTVVESEFFAQMEEDSLRNHEVAYFGAFFRETDELCGYVRAPFSQTLAQLQIQKTKPAFEKYQVNAALVYGVLCAFQEQLAAGYYICDGARSISHETKFQDYLEKYFGFRKAYCTLHITYHPKVAWLIKLLYPFRKLIAKLDGINLFHQISGVMKMEEIVRNEDK